MPRPLRLMTWNVRSLRDDRNAVVRVVRACAPDVLFVQEAPRFLRPAARLAALARESGLVVATGGAAGVALLSTLRVDIDAAEGLPLTRSRGRHQRGVAVASATVAGRSFTAISVHLGLDAGERRRHVAEVRRILSARHSPVVLGGDLNEQSSGSAWRTLASGMLDAGDPDGTGGRPTFPASAPSKRIDTVLVPPHWGVIARSPSDIVDESDLVAATDHRPVIVDVVD